MYVERHNLKTTADRLKFLSWLFDTGSCVLNTKELRKEFSGRGLSKSSLDYVRRSIDHYFGPKIKQTEAMVIGSAFHCLLLESDKFDSRYCKTPEFDRRTKKGKEEYAEFLETIGDRHPLKIVDWIVIHNMVKSIRNHPRASELLDAKYGVAEETVVWNDERTGVLMKGRIDWRNMMEFCIVEVKSCMDADPLLIKRDLFSDKLRYYVQASMYVDGFNAATDFDDWRFKMIYVEKSNPYGVCICDLDDLSLECGRRAYGKDLDRIVDWYSNAQDSNGEEVFAGYSNDEIKLTPPNWILYDHGIKKITNF